MSSNCPIECRQGAIEILNTLRDAGFETYFAGGCVRDRLLSDAPTEYDIATSAKPDEIRKLFANAKSVGIVFCCDLCHYLINEFSLPIAVVTT